MSEPKQSLISIVTPAWKEADNLPVLYERLVTVLEGKAWEWIIIDDHSPDSTFDVIRALSSKDPRVRGIRLSRNSGSHVALACGINQADGACAILIAADLQDPPETIPQLMEKWEEGNKVVWAVRADREGESATTKGFSRLYYWIMRRVVGMKEMPATGADFLLMDKKVVEAFNRFTESNVSILSLITWMGFKQTRIFYTKEARLHGESGWTFHKKCRLVMDSITSFTHLPIRLMSIAGGVVALAGFVYALYILYMRLHNPDMTTGFAATMIAILVLGGLQMMMMGVLGEYLWRNLDESRRRPRYMIEEDTQDTL